MGGLYLARRLVGTVDTMSYINVGNPCVHIDDDLLLITYVELHLVYGVQLDFHYIPAVV